jgi:hypothetical protein
MTDAPAPQDGRQEVLLWQDALHEKLDAEHLHFYRLSFSPSYERAAIYDRLKKVCQRFSVLSYVVYETLGEYDLLIRMWVPTRYESEDVELALFGELGDLDIRNIEDFTCRTRFHWARTKLIEDELDQLPIVDDETVHAVNEFNERQMRGEHVPRDGHIQDLVESNIVVPVPTDTRGVRFFITFGTANYQAFTPKMREAILDLIQDKCTAVAEAWTNVPDCTDPQFSIYYGRGRRIEYLIMVRAPHPRFHDFVRDLVLGLRETQLSGVFGMRPYTHVIADQMFSDFSEQRSLTLDEETGDSQINVFSDESETLEFKATFAIDFRSLRAVGRREQDATRINAFAHAVCGLLNSPSGGTLVVGVLETRRELERAPRPDEYLNWLTENFGYHPGDNVGMRELPNAVVGIETEVGPEGPFADRDKYLQRMTEALRTLITPAPLPFVRIEFQPTANGRTVCVLRVRPADTWFYVKAADGKHLEFVVREAVSSRVYDGAESDLYKQAHPRKQPNGSSRRADG